MADPQVVAFIGASSVYGKVDTEGGFVGRFRTWWEEKNPDHNKVYNLGICGDTSTGMACRIASELAMRDPQAVVISLGSNDVAHLGAPDAPSLTSRRLYRDNVTALITHARRFAPIVLCVSAYPIDDSKTQPFRDTDKYYFMSDLSAYVDDSRAICESLKVPYLDLFSLFMKEGVDQYLFRDGLHANPAGHERIFRAVRDFFTSSIER